MIAGIILAGGKGTRIKSTTSNKVTLPFLNKPMILYGVELLQKVCDPVVVVVGAFADSVRNVLHQYKVLFADQTRQLGTGHAASVAMEELNRKNLHPDTVLVGYGDHMMFYSVENAKDLISFHQKQKAAVTLVTTELDDPHSYGRVIRNPKTREVLRVVEEKDANEEEKKVKEVNAGLYCFDGKFLEVALRKIPMSPVTHEYYLPELINIARAKKKTVAGFPVPFSSVGIGINRTEELEESQKIYICKTHRDEI